MPTEVDLKLGLNLEIGSVPVALDVEIDSQSAQTTYTFDGCVQNAVIPLGEFIGYVGQQFGVDVQLPPELNLHAEIDYLVGQVIYTKPTTGNPTTELGAAGKFELSVYDDTYSFTFYADTVISSPAPATGNPYVIGASIDLDLDFAKLPLVGVIPGFNDLTLTNVGFSYTKEAAGADKPVEFHIPQVSTSDNPLYTRQDPSAPNKTNYSIDSKGNKQTFNLTKGGFALTAGFTKKSTGEALNNFALPMALPPTTPPPVNPPPAPFYNGNTSPPGGSVHWININKTFGPVDLKKIGLNYSQGEATFGFSAGFALGGFSLGVEGMTITFPLPLPGMPAGNTVSFDIQGLSMDIKEGNLEIGGAFLKVEEDGVSSYYGEAVLQVATFGFKALGGYTPAHDAPDPNHQGKTLHIPPSFFLYANINVPLGGPPYLFVNGLAGGFGINNELVLPTLEQLPTYILLPHNAPAESGSAQSTVTSVLPQLQKYFLDMPGEYWLAAGVQVSSFEMINVFALVTVSFGVDFQIALLGNASMSFPTGDPAPIAYVEIDVMASYSQSSGLLAVAGVLSPASYIFGPFCQLTGGFAFYIWFGGPHQDDFVVTLGGYHPAFKKPDYYPTVPRLGINFSLGPIHVTGGSYFALTPAMFMAGGSMSATWSIPAIKAWFTMGVDFLIAWAPFHYEADIYASIGVSADLGLFTINLHIGADVYLWGPAFGGRADVDLDVISFTIHFGAEASTPPPIGWQDFRTSFLPADTGSSQSTNRSRRMLAAAAAASPAETNIVKASVPSGLLGSGVEGFNWIVDPDQFVIVVNSTIPVNQPKWVNSEGQTVDVSDDVSAYNATPVDVENGPYLKLGTKQATYSATQVWNPDLSIRPMKQDNVQSVLTLQVSKRAASDPPGTYSQPINTLSIQPQTASSNAAMWLKNPDKPSPNDPALVPFSLTGFQLSPIPRNPSSVNNVPLIQLLFQKGNEAYYSFGSAAVDTRYQVTATLPTPDQLTIKVSGQAAETLENDNYILSSLEDKWVVSQRAAILDDLNTNGFTTYTPQDVNLSILATQTALTDWPQVLLLGDDLAA
ncbi:MAG: hypothetical protein H6585_02540 [Flavobacteriales bacterium]|nr:hypothetical protein [Flavobacteriales bacterium]MCB9447207.1 hypothetical protein [Flavobacteriales bacterium]